MFRIKSILFVCFLLLQSNLEAETGPVSVLTIGNSFAENALKYLPQLAESAGRKLAVGRANLGGCTLERHWKHVVEYEKDPTGAEGSPYSKGTKSLHDLLTARDWDFVTIQQVSYKSHDPATYEPFAENLIAYIRERAPRAKILVQQIWAYRIDDPRFVPKNEGREPHTHAEMYEQVRRAYHALAKKYQLGIIPSGDAMFAADTDSRWGYRIDDSFDPKEAAFPDLPDQQRSLHVGWVWKRSSKEAKPELKIDGHHANATGEYLLGCVWFERLLGESVVENSFVPKGISPDYARFLRETAHESVAEAGPLQVR